LKAIASRIDLENSRFCSSPWRVFDESKHPSFEGVVSKGGHKRILFLLTRDTFVVYSLNLTTTGEQGRIEMSTLHTLLVRPEPSKALVLRFAVRRAAFVVARRAYRFCDRLVLRARIAFLTFAIDSTGRYIAQCSVDGLDQSLSIREFCAQMSADIGERAALRSRL
jgi:hypothetical protein